MFIIYGWSTWDSIDSRGTFNCEECRAPQQYELHRSTTYFTLFFVPILPLRSVGGQVKCTGCGDWFSPTALSNPVQEPRGGEALRHILVSLCARAGRTEANAVARIKQLLEHSGFSAPYDLLLQKELAKRASELVDLRTTVLQSFGSAPLEVRQQLFQSASWVLKDGRPETEGDRVALAEFGRGLGVG